MDAPPEKLDANNRDIAEDASKIDSEKRNSRRKTMGASVIISILAVVAIVAISVLWWDRKRSGATVLEVVAAAAAGNSTEVGGPTPRDSEHLSLNQVFGDTTTVEVNDRQAAPPSVSATVRPSSASTSVAAIAPSTPLYEIVYVSNGNNEYDQWGVGPTPLYSYPNKNNRNRPPTDYYSVADGDGVVSAVGGGSGGGGGGGNARAPLSSHVSAPKTSIVYAIPMEDDNVVYAIPLDGMDVAGGGSGGCGATPSHTGNGDAGRLFEQQSQNTTAFTHPQVTRRRNGDGNGSNTEAPEYDLAAAGNSANHYGMQAPRVRRSGRGAGSPASPGLRASSTSVAAAAPEYDLAAAGNSTNHYDMQAPRVRRTLTSQPQQKQEVANFSSRGGGGRNIVGRGATATAHAGGK